MIQSVWLFVGVVAILATAAAVLTTDDGVGIIVGLIGFGAWLIVAFGSLNVEVVTDSGAVESFSLPAVAVLCTGLSLLPGYIALTGPVTIITEAKDPNVDDL